MRHYAEMANGMDKLDRLNYGSGKGKWSVCMRRCPECNRLLVTNHDVFYECNGCGYEDYRPVDKYRKAGLDYAVTQHLHFGKRSPVPTKWYE